MYRIIGNIAPHIRAAVADGSIEELCKQLDKLAVKDCRNEHDHAVRVALYPKVTATNEIVLNFLMDDEETPYMSGALFHHSTGEWTVNT